MAKQKGHHRIIGTTGDMTYQKTKDGYTVKEKMEISADAIRNSEKYERVRENIAEFGRAGKAGKLLRVAFASFLKVTSDTRMSSRLTTEFLRVIKSDPISDRGKRAVLLGDLPSMTGFNFNVATDLIKAFHAPFTTAVDRVTGQCNITIPAFQVKDAITVPEGVSHARFLAGAALLDLDNYTYVSDMKYSNELVLGDESAAAITLSTQVTAQSPLPLFLVLGIQYFMSTNAKLYTLNKAFNALALVKIDMPA